MFGWFGKKQRKDERWGDYNGKGIWYICPDRNTPQPTAENDAFRWMLRGLCRKLSDSSNELYDRFGLLNRNGSWEVIPDQALFKFNNAAGQTCYARYGLVASWNENSHSWMWAWGMPEGWVHPKALSVAQETRRIGEERNWQALTERLLLVDENEAWHLTQLAADLSGLPMVYRAKVNEINTHYYAIDRPVWLA
ncbi:MAG: DUF6882 domain-containing protein [Pseudomonadota bacterium]